jgi:hypothetical protein
MCDFVTATVDREILENPVFASGFSGALLVPGVDDRGFAAWVFLREISLWSKKGSQ